MATRVVSMTPVPQQSTLADFAAALSQFGRTLHGLITPQGEAIVEMEKISEAAAVVESGRPLIICGVPVRCSFSRAGSAEFFRRNAMSLSAPVAQTQRPPPQAHSWEQPPVAVMQQQQQPPPMRPGPGGRTLAITIRNVMYKITVQTLEQVLRPYGELLRCVIFDKPPDGLQAMAEFASPAQAAAARAALNDKDIYDNCCTLSIETSPRDTPLIVRENNERQWDWAAATAAQPPIRPQSALGLPPQQQQAAAVGYPPAGVAPGAPAYGDPHTAQHHLLLQQQQQQQGYAAAGSTPRYAGGVPTANAHAALGDRYDAAPALGRGSGYAADPSLAVGPGRPPYGSDVPVPAVQRGYAGEAAPALQQQQHQRGPPAYDVPAYDERGAYVQSSSGAGYDPHHLQRAGNASGGADYAAPQARSGDLHSSAAAAGYGTAVGSGRSGADYPAPPQQRAADYDLSGRHQRGAAAAYDNERGGGGRQGPGGGDYAPYDGGGRSGGPRPGASQLGGDARPDRAGGFSQPYGDRDRAPAQYGSGGGGDAGRAPDRFGDSRGGGFTNEAGSSTSRFSEAGSSTSRFSEAVSSAPRFNDSRVPASSASQSSSYRHADAPPTAARDFRGNAQQPYHDRSDRDRPPPSEHRDIRGAAGSYGGRPADSYRGPAPSSGGGRDWPPPNVSRDWPPRDDDRRGSGGVNARHPVTGRFIESPVVFVFGLPWLKSTDGIAPPQLAPAGAGEEEDDAEHQQHHTAAAASEPSASSAQQQPADLAGDSGAAVPAPVSADAEAGAAAAAAPASSSASVEGSVDGAHEGSSSSKSPIMTAAGLAKKQQQAAAAAAAAAASAATEQIRPVPPPPAAAVTPSSASVSEKSPYVLAVTPDMLYNMFCNYGGVLRVKLLLRPAGSAMVEMAEPSQALVAIAHLKSAIILDSPIHLQLSKYHHVMQSLVPAERPLFKEYSLARQPHGGKTPKMVHGPCRTLFYFNGPPGITEQAVLELLEKQGCRPPADISQMTPATYDDGGRGGGGRPVQRPACGFLDYADLSAAADAIMRANNTEVSGYTFRVAYAGKDRQLIANTRRPPPPGGRAGSVGSATARPDGHPEGGQGGDSGADASAESGVGSKRRRTASADADDAAAAAAHADDANQPEDGSGGANASAVPPPDSEREPELEQKQQHQPEAVAAGAIPEVQSSVAQ